MEIANHLKAMRTVFSIFLSLSHLFLIIDAQVANIWSSLDGISASDYAYAICTDGSALYSVGYTNGNLDGIQNAGSSDGFVIKYDQYGQKQYTKLLGTAYSDGIFACGGKNGGIFVGGYTGGNLDGVTAGGGGDAFVTYYLSDGTKQWTRLISTTSVDQASGIAASSDNYVYITGYTYGNLDSITNSGVEDVFLVKFDISGNKIWSRLFGTPSSDYGNAVAVSPDGSIVYVAGNSFGAFDSNTNLGNGDGFLIAYSSSGNKLWSRMVSTSASDSLNGVAVDSNGDIYCTGFVSASWNGQNAYGSQDIVIAKYTSNGTLLWNRIQGTSSSDTGTSISINTAEQQVIVAGRVSAALNGQPYAGSTDAVTIAWSFGGDRIFTRILGTSNGDHATGVASLSNGDFAMVGYSSGKFRNQTNHGGNDAFLSYFSDCEIGYYCPGLTRDSCPPGAYCPTIKAFTWVGCGVGNYNPNTGSTNSTDCLACPSGSYCDQALNANFNLCPGGYYCSNVTQSPISCSVGTYCPSGSTSASLCPEGFYCPAISTSPISCSSGSYCLAGSSSSTTCPAGYFCSNTSTISSCSSPAYCPPSSVQPGVCPAGSYCSNPSTIITCPAGSYCPQGSMVPTACSSGSYCAAGAASASSCPAGNYCPQGSSTPTSCTAGSYCPQGSAAPITCSSGSYCPAGASSSIICTAGNYCPSGSSAPVSCSSGAYCPFGSVAPSACPAGFYCATPSSQTSCPAGNYCPPQSFQPTSCSQGNYCVVGSSSPSSCPAGKLCSSPSTIAICPAGFYCPSGSSVATQCTSGNYCAAGSSSPVSCGSGDYCPFGSSAPTTCPSGSYCTTPSSLVICSAGTYCPSGSTSPSMCPVGSYCSTQSSQPTPCVVGDYCAAGSSSNSSCMAGYYCPDPSTITICPGGTFSFNASVTCFVCPAGSYCPQGSEMAITCPFNSICPSGAAMWQPIASGDEHVISYVVGFVSFLLVVILAFSFFYSETSSSSSNDQPNHFLCNHWLLSWFLYTSPNSPTLTSRGSRCCAMCLCILWNFMLSLFWYRAYDNVDVSAGTVFGRGLLTSIVLTPAMWMNMVVVLTSPKADTHCYKSLASYFFLFSQMAIVFAVTVCYGYELSSDLSKLWIGSFVTTLFFDGAIVASISSKLLTNMIVFCQASSSLSDPPSKDAVSQVVNGDVEMNNMDVKHAQQSLDVNVVIAEPITYAASSEQLNGRDSNNQSIDNADVNDANITDAKPEITVVLEPTDQVIEVNTDNSIHDEIDVPKEWTKTLDNNQDHVITASDVVFNEDGESK